MPTIQKDAAEFSYLIIEYEGITLAEIELHGYEIVEEYEYGDGRPVEEHIGWADVSMIGSVLEKGKHKHTEIYIDDMPMREIAERAFDKGPQVLTPAEFAAAMQRRSASVMQAAE